MTEQWAWRSHSTCLLGFLAGKPGSTEQRPQGWAPSLPVLVGHRVFGSFSCCWVLAFRIVGYSRPFERRWAVRADAFHLFFLCPVCFKLIYF